MFKKYFIISIGILALASCGSDADPSDKKEKPSAENVYLQNCSICHGDDGKLGVSGAKDLSTSVMSMEERVSIIKNGKNGMTPFQGMISDEEINLVAEYITSLRK